MIIKHQAIGLCLIAILILLLSYAGFLSYQSIDWTVLQRLESQKLILPTPLPSQTLLPTPTK